LPIFEPNIGLLTTLRTDLIGRRVGSYIPNSWVSGGWPWLSGLPVSATSSTSDFTSEDQIQQPSQTPVFGDGVLFGAEEHNSAARPKATDRTAGHPLHCGGEIGGVT